MSEPQNPLKRVVTFAVLLLSGFVLPASTSALPMDESAHETAPRADTPSVPSLWDQPASVTPVVVVRAPAAPPPPPEHAVSANPLWAVPLATLSNTRERPIFSSSRRPPPPAVAPVTVAKAPPPPKPPRVERPQLALVGTISSGDESFAIFIDQASRAALRLRVGEDFQGWRLRAVHGREVILERDRQTEILSLPQPGASQTSALRAQAADGEPADPPRRGNRRQ
jgi:general secretion pathway protein N